MSKRLPERKERKKKKKKQGEEGKKSLKQKPLKEDQKVQTNLQP